MRLRFARRYPMRKQFTCSQGHHWEVTLDGQFSAAVECIVCPACGSAAETLVAADPEATLDPDPKTVSRKPDETASAPPIDRVSVTGYEILSELGQGGMAVVYKARQVRLKRIVALKMILPRSRVKLEQLERFRLEAEASARLQHPHIVQIYEIGEQADRPYFSLEFVEGGSLDKKLAGTPQPAGTAAELLEILAGAIHYAHQHGIVHRDLKPANVLLSADGAPKITDFGLAKQLDAEMDQTQSGAILGTASYMAPEQAQSQKKQVGPLSDVYALGAILYEMLTGRPPFRGTTVLETLEQVRSQEPVSPRRLQPRVPRDLETICLKCLEKEPRKRYGSALALAEDLGRFLKNEPIQARPVNNVERLWRWCRRKPALAGALAALALAVVGGFGGVFWQWRLAEEQRSLAQQKREEADQSFRRAVQAVNDSFTQVSENQLLNQPGLQGLRKKLLQSALAYYQDFLQQRGNDPSMLVQIGETHYRIGRINNLLGDQARALEASRQAVQIFQPLLDADPEDPALRQHLAQAYTQISLIQTRTGDHAAAIQSQEEAVSTLEAWARDRPADLELQKDLAMAVSELGRRQLENFRISDAGISFERALRIRKPLALAHPGDSTLEDHLAATYINLSIVQARSGQLAAALPYAKEALAIRERRAAASPSPRSQENLADQRANLGMMLLRLGRFPEAQQAHEKARDLRRRLVGENPLVPEYRHKLAVSLNVLGVVHARQGHSDEALAMHREALAFQQQLVRDIPLDIHFQNLLAFCHLCLGEAQAASAQFEEAIRSFQAAAEICEEHARRDPQFADARVILGKSLSNTGQVLAVTGDHATARQRYEEARRIEEQLVRENAEHSALSALGKTWHRLGQVHRQLEQSKEAVAAYQQAIVRQRAAFEQSSDFLEYRQLLCQHYRELAGLQRALDHPAEAAAATRERRQLWPHEPNELYQVARELALCIPLVAKGRAELNVQEQAERQKYADQALETLRQAVSHGFEDAERLQNEPDLAPLRQYPDFPKLLKELKEKAKTPPGPACK